MDPIPQKDAPPSQSFVRFVIVGSAGAALFLVLLYTLNRLGLSPFWSDILAYAGAFGFAYLGQRHWTFGSRRRHAHSLPSYFALQVVCALGSAFIAQTAVGTFHLSVLAMSFLTTGCAGLFSFVVSSKWVFRE
jgi:putative flippase GtrA